MGKCLELLTPQATKYFIILAYLNKNMLVVRIWLLTCTEGFTPQLIVTLNVCYFRNSPAILAPNYKAIVARHIENFPKTSTPVDV